MHSRFEVNGLCHDTRLATRLNATPSAEPSVRHRLHLKSVGERSLCKQMCFFFLPLTLHSHFSAAVGNGIYISAHICR